MLLALLEPLLKQAIMQGLQQKTKAKVEKLGAMIFLSLLASFFVFAGIVFLLYGVFEKMLTWYSAPEAALAVAIITFFLSLGSGVAALLVARYQKNHAPPPPDLSKTIHNTVETLASLLSEFVEQPVKHNPATAILLAGLAGYLTNKRFH